MSLLEAKRHRLLAFGVLVARMSTPLSATRPRKVLLQDFTSLFVRDRRHGFRRWLVEIVHSPNERQVLVHGRHAAAVFVILHRVLHSVFQAVWMRFARIGDFEARLFSP